MELEGYLRPWLRNQGRLLLFEDIWVDTIRGRSILYEVLNFLKDLSFKRTVPYLYCEPEQSLIAHSVVMKKRVIPNQWFALSFPSGNKVGTYIFILPQKCFIGTRLIQFHRHYMISWWCVLILQFQRCISLTIADLILLTVLVIWTLTV